MVLAPTVPIHLYQCSVLKRTLEATDTVNVAELRRKMKEQGGILRLSLTKRNIRQFDSIKTVRTVPQGSGDSVQETIFL